VETVSRGRAGDRGAARRGEAGFTILELVVAMVVLLLAVLLACDLLDQSARLLHHSVRRARDPWSLLAAELLRNDLRGAAPPLEWGGHGPLELYTSAGRVTWSRSDDGDLVRAVSGGAAHAYIHDVRSFGWRRVAINAVEVTVRYRVSTPYLRNLRGTLPTGDEGQLEELRVLMVTRIDPSPSRTGW
jgi:type II secretory pathway component PulJ